MLTARTTLTQFLIEERRRHPDASGELNALVLDVAMACKAISRIVAHGTLRDRCADSPATAATRRHRRTAMSSRTKCSFAATNGAVISLPWCPRKWRCRTRYRRSIRRAGTCCCSTRSTGHRISTSTCRWAASFRSCAPATPASTPSPPTSCSPGRARSAPATRSTVRRRCWCSRSARECTRSRSIRCSASSSSPTPIWRFPA